MLSFPTPMPGTKVVLMQELFLLFTFLLNHETSPVLQVTTVYATLLVETRRREMAPHYFTMVNGEP